MRKVKFKILENKDAEKLFELLNRNKGRLTRYFPITIKSNNNIKSTIEYLKDLNEKFKKNEFYVYGIYDQQILIGMIFIKNIDWRIPKCELGYFLDKTYEGKGIMSKVLKNIVNHCFESLKMKKIFLKIGSENIGSKRVAKKNGFVLEGILRREFRIETNEIIDVEYYGKLNFNTQ
nr:GNAT family protein [uncultured Psychroserpens sp.]